MKPLFRKFKPSWFIAFCLTSIAAIVVCNLWSLYWGHCVLNDFLRIPVMGWVLIGANLVAIMIFVTIKRNGKKDHDGYSCNSCHSILRDIWVYCPNCGDEQTH